MSSEGLPSWVEAEIWNWCRHQWQGPMPGNLVWYGPEDDRPEPPPVLVAHAERVHKVYEALPLVEQRVVQAEYTRRKEYGDMAAHERVAAASRKLDIPQAYYRIALGSFKKAVMRAFL